MAQSYTGLAAPKRKLNAPQTGERLPIGDLANRQVPSLGDQAQLAAPAAAPVIGVGLRSSTHPMGAGSPRPVAPGEAIVQASPSDSIRARTAGMQQANQAGVMAGNTGETAPGHYAQNVQAGGLYSNQDAQTYAGNTGYMPRKTVGGAFGQPSPAESRAAGNAGINYADQARTQFGAHLPGYEPITGLRPQPQQAGPAPGVMTQERADQLFPGKYTVTPGHDGTTSSVRPNQARTGPLRLSDGSAAWSPVSTRHNKNLTESEQAEVTAAQNKAAAKYGTDEAPSPNHIRDIGRQKRYADAISGNPQTPGGANTARAIGRSEARRLRSGDLSFEEEMTVRDPRYGLGMSGLRSGERIADADRASLDKRHGNTIGLEDRRIKSNETVAGADRTERTTSEERRIKAAAEAQEAAIAGDKDITGLRNQGLVDVEKERALGVARGYDIQEKGVDANIDSNKLEKSRQQAEGARSLRLQAQEAKNQRNYELAATLEAQAAAMDQQPASAQGGPAGASPAGGPPPPPTPLVPWRAPGARFDQLPQKEQEALQGVPPEQLPQAIRQLIPNIDQTSVDSMIKKITGKTTASAYDPGGYGIENFLGEAFGLENINRFSGGRDVPMLGGMPEMSTPVDPLSRMFTGEPFGRASGRIGTGLWRNLKKGLGFGPTPKP